MAVHDVWDWLYIIFSGGAVKKLKHLTTAIRLDYHEFINSVEQTLFYAAQQVEASLDNYYPPTVLVRTSKVASSPGSLIFSCIYWKDWGAWRTRVSGRKRLSPSPQNADDIIVVFIFFFQLISSSVPKCKILRNAAKPGVIAHVYVSYES